MQANLTGDVVKTCCRNHQQAASNKQQAKRRREGMQAHGQAAGTMGPALACSTSDALAC